MGPRLCGLKLFALLKTFIPSPYVDLLTEKMVTLKVVLEGVFGGGGGCFTHFKVYNYAVRIVFDNLANERKLLLQLTF